jgi:hypothetical protein
MTGRVLRGKGILLEGRRKHFERRIYFVGDFLWRSLWCEEFGFGGFLVNQKQGAPVCWGFWARGPGFLSVSWS